MSLASQLETYLQADKRETRSTTLAQTKGAAEIVGKFYDAKIKATVDQTNAGFAQVSDKFDTNQKEIDEISAKIDLSFSKTEATDLRNNLENTMKTEAQKVNGKLTELENKVINFEGKIARIETWYNQHWLTGQPTTGQTTGSQAQAQAAGGATTSTTQRQGASLPPATTATRTVMMVEKIEKIMGDKFLPDFSVTSEQSFDEWSQRFSDVLTASGTTDKDKQLALLKLKLTGWARQRYDELTDDEKNTLVTTLAALKTKLDTSESHHLSMARLKALPKMIEGQNVLQYAEKLEKAVIKALIGKAPEIVQARLLEEFLDRLPFNVSFYVKDKTPATFQAALEHARKYEALWITPPGVPNVNAVVATEIAGLKNEIVKMQSTLPNQQQKTSFDYSTVECFKCGKKGHFARNCRSTQRREVPMAGRQQWAPKKTLEDDIRELQKQMSTLTKMMIEKEKPGVNALVKQPQEKEMAAKNEIVHFDFSKNDLWLVEEKAEEENIKSENLVLEETSTDTVSDGCPRDTDQKPKMSFRGLPLTLMLILTFFSVATAKPMICQNGAPPMILSLPKQLPCATETPIIHNPQAAIVSIYQPNIGLHETKAFHCRKVHEKIAYWTSVENEDFQKPTFTEKEVSLEECKHMMAKKECSHGKLIEKNGYFSTDLKAQFEFGWPIFRSFYYRYAEVENCLISPTTIFTKNANKTMSSPTGDLSDCDYERGYCQLADKSMLIWKNAGFSGCNYNFFRTWDGYVSDNLSWVKKDGEFALTFRNPKTIIDCQERLVQSDQGYCILERNFESLKIAKRPKRETDVGVVLSPQLSSQLTAAMEAMHRMVVERFAHFQTNDCASVQAIWAGFLTTAEKNPTQALRGLLQRNDIQARTIAPRLFEIFPCTFLKKEDWEIRQSQECVKQQPIWLKITEKKRKAFLDQENMIVTEKASAIDCSLVNSRFLRLGEKVLKIGRLSGKITNVDIHEWTPASSNGAKTAGLPHQLQMFQNLPMTKVDELLPINSLETIINEAHLNAAIESHLRETPLGNHIYDENGATNIVTQGWFDSILSLNISWFKVLTMISNMYVLFLITKNMLIPLALKYLMSTSSLRLLRGVGGPRVPDQKPDSLNFSNNDLEANWPPKIVASLDSSSDFLPLCVGLINSKPCLFMLDTGSSLSLCTLKKAKEYGIDFERLEKDGLETVMGEKVPIIGKQTVTIDFGKKTIETEIYITVAPLSNRFEILLGVPALEKLSPILFDFDNKVLKFDNEKQNFFIEKINNEPKMILSLNEKDAEPVTIKVRINNQTLVALIDSGACCNILSSNLAPYVGVFEALHSDMEVVSASGGKLPIIAEAKVNLGLGKLNIPIDVHFVQATAVSSRYDIILGRTALQRLPPMTIDWEKELLSFGEEKFFFGKPIWRDGTKVKVLETMRIPPKSQTVLTVQLDTHALKPEVLLIEPQPQKKPFLINASVAAPFEKNKIKVVINNDDENFITIYKGMTLGKAYEIAQNAETKTGEALSIEEIEIDPKYKVDISEAEITEEQKQKLQELLDEFDCIFSKNSRDLGDCIEVAAKLETTTEVPPKCRPYRLPEKYRAEVGKHIQDLIKSGRIYESETAWAFPIVVVPKKDGSIRICVDYRKLNEISVFLQYPLPILDTILERLSGAQFLSAIDCSKAYNQIPLDPETQKKVSVMTQDGVYSWRYMPFGLMNATQIFSKICAKLLKPVTDVAVNYVDDVTIFNHTGGFEGHLDALRRVFTQFREFKIKLSGHKCFFFRKSIDLLGFTVDENGTRPADANTQKIRDFPPCKNVTETKRWIGLCSFFRKFIRGFSDICEPLTELTKNDVPFKWGEEQQNSMDKMKELLCSKPILRFPDWDKDMHIFCDASACAQSASLCQWDEEVKAYYAIAHGSRVMSSVERNYAACHAEMGSVIYGIRHFKPYLIGRKVIIHSDHKAITFLMSKRNTCPKLARWVLELQEMRDLHFQFIKGKQNTLSDALSRVEHEGDPIPLEELEDCFEPPLCLNIAHLIDAEIPANVLLEEDIGGEIKTIDVLKEQEKEPQLKKFIDFLKNEKLPKNEKEAEKIKKQAEKFQLDELGRLCLSKKASEWENLRVNPIIIPNSLKKLIFEFFHTSLEGGMHLSVRKAMSKAKHYFWNGMGTDFRKWAEECVVCQKRRKPVPPIRVPIVASNHEIIWETISLDLAGPYPECKGFRYVMNVIDLFSSYLISVPCPDARAVTLAQLLWEKVVLVHSAPLRLLTDNGSAFTSEFYLEFCKLLDIDKKFSTVAWSRGNSLVERSFRTMQDAIAKKVKADHSNWVDFLAPMAFAYNTSTQLSTKYSPYFLVFGRDCVFSIDRLLFPQKRRVAVDTDASQFLTSVMTNMQTAWEWAHFNVEKQKEEMIARYNEKCKLPRITVGCRVWLKRVNFSEGKVRKFQLPYIRQYRVLKIVHPWAYIISISNPKKSAPRRVHLNQIKPYIEPSGPALTKRKLPLIEKRELEASEAQPEKIFGFCHPSDEDSTEEEEEPSSNDEEKQNELPPKRRIIPRRRYSPP